MRKVTFVKSNNLIRKLMVYESRTCFHLFLYDSLDDRASIADFTFHNLESVDLYCLETYNVNDDDWIPISDPLRDAQVDFIKPTYIKGKDIGDPPWGKYQYLFGKWVDISPSDKHLHFNGLSENECLFIVGLLDEFDQAKINDAAKAIKILNNLNLSIDTIFTFVPRQKYA